jgi:hypothetical protein
MNALLEIMGLHLTTRALYAPNTNNVARVFLSFLLVFTISALQLQSTLSLGPPENHGKNLPITRRIFGKV